ncbi:hypothetical protein [Geodermatophilus sp. DSM 44513]|uniref:hypothetical protein n=1 Tax=Geodermatophilus sp. DSM 44513 TaxID=1528104 RepID=UPI001270E263|nr:hypothetical protein [Geodermatophilus sp. DSM 44513]WNV75581.1 hypothetical protein RTG05_21785 [Geodermatophilus sp. DSM 44513]
MGRHSAPRRTARDPDRRRLTAICAAGLTDSLFLSVGWTLVVLQIADSHGLPAVGFCTAAMLVGVALSAPVAGRAARLGDGRRVLRAAAGTEMALRTGLVLLVAAQAPIVLTAVVIGAMNVTAWTGYAAMRAEVAAVRPGAGALTGYGTLVAAAEATGVALAALVSVTAEDGGALLLGVACCYVLSLVPTVVVAGASRVPRMVSSVADGVRLVPSGPVLAGALLMVLAAGPTLLFVALSEQVHGRGAVALAAVAFTAGSLLAPLVVRATRRAHADGGVTWSLAAAGMVAGWTVAPLSVVLLCTAQVLSGLCLTLLEGLLDDAAVRRRPGQVTGALASVTAGRALGGAAATGVLPLVLTGVPMATVAVTATGVLLATAGAAALSGRVRRAGKPRETTSPVARRAPALPLGT